MGIKYLDRRGRGERTMTIYTDFNHMPPFDMLSYDAAGAASDKAAFPIRVKASMNKGIAEGVCFIKQCAWYDSRGSSIPNEIK